jgi:hypothetical protein
MLGGSCIYCTMSIGKIKIIHKTKSAGHDKPFLVRFYVVYPLLIKDCNRNICGNSRKTHIYIMYVMFIYIYAYGRNNIILLDDVPTLKFMYFRVSRLAMLDTP